MANGEIPVTGSAVGPQGTFPIEPTKTRPGDDNLIIRANGKKLHIVVNNGAGKTFDENLEDPGWTLLIRQRQGSE